MITEPMNFAMLADENIDNVDNVDTTTLQSIICYGRTQTTRSYWVNGLPKKDDIIVFKNFNKNEPSVKVIITNVYKLPKVLTESFLNSWSHKERWTIDAAIKKGFFKKNSYCVEFKLMDIIP